MILSYCRTMVLYLILIAVVRIMGKRQVGQMEPAEFVVTMLAANLASIPMQDGAIPLYSGLVPILTVLGTELVLSWLTLRSVFLRRILCGKPVVLIENGRILQDSLRTTRVSLDELTAALREKEILTFSQVQFAILETNGTLSVFPAPAQSPPGAEDLGVSVKPRYLPVTLVSDGRLLRENLAKAGVDETCVEQLLKSRGTDRESTLLLTLDAGGNIQWIGKEYGG